MLNWTLLLFPAITLSVYNDLDTVCVFVGVGEDCDSIVSVVFLNTLNNWKKYTRLGDRDDSEKYIYRKSFSVEIFLKGDL